MDNNVFEIVRTYNLGGNKKISIRSDGKFYYTVNGLFQEYLPNNSGLTVDNGELYYYHNGVKQKYRAELFPSSMLWYKTLIDFDNYGLQWGKNWPRFTLNGENIQPRYRIMQKINLKKHLY